ncbi:polysaccharide deacetylase family protein [Microaceticoccus formicicus]|uniref:polysaccharide deacetylase family protein n=1 Tax=Microaceticoccus formicicus TaxID=3118105 RepID=UPI003CD046F8|nr:polysaccharide deacetylase family protein [Peptoniphilaceae bacterium AMB_02]
MKKFKILFLLLLSLILISCSRIDAEPELDSAFDAENKEDPNDKIYTEIQEEIEVKIESDADEEAKKPDELIVENTIDTETIIEKYKDSESKHWGDQIEGIYYRLATDEKIAALTFDACGGSETANGYDIEIIEFLKRKKIPATLFVTKPWIEANEEAFKDIISEPLFEIGNHGNEHRPLSVITRTAYGIESTSSVREAIDEIMISSKFIESKTNKIPQYFRSGTAYTDDVSLEILKDLKMKFIGYDIAADAGATLNGSEILGEFQKIRPGSIILMHFNHPESQSYEGLVKGVEFLENQGYKFGKLSDFELIGH